MSDGSKKDVLVMFGGVSAEHEVSVISGLQVMEKIDRTLYEPHAIYVTKNGSMQYIGDLATRKDFLRSPQYPYLVGTASDAHGVLAVQKLFSKKIHPYAAFLAFHGGMGESGPVQGFLESCGIPHTGSTTEGAVISMNKTLTSQVLASVGVRTVAGLSVFARDIQKNSLTETENVIQHLGLPVITKPVHLGSSIGITIVRDANTLERALLEASYVDDEIRVEKLLTNFVEYNCSLRRRNDQIEVSPIERPIAKDEILSFADKYQRGGGKKTGNKQSGMASLDREIPAKISDELKKRIEDAAKKAYIACRQSGVPRIDFMYVKDTDELFLTEINPIPGSLAFYLWEAAGVPFTQQITDAIETAVHESKDRASKVLDYKTDIVEKFCQ